MDSYNKYMKPYISVINPLAGIRFLQLRSAVKKNDVDKVRELIERGADTNYLWWIGSKRKLVKLILMEKCKDDNNEILKLLIQPGIPKKALRSIFTRLLENKTSNDSEILDLLIKHGFSIDDAWALGCRTGRIIHVECRGEKYSLIQYSMQMRRDFVPTLLKLGADPNKCTKFTNLEFAVKRNDLESVKDLVKHGADVNEIHQDNYRRYDKTALHYITKSDADGWTESAYVLMELGADLNILNDNGLTPLANADSSMRTPLIKKLARIKMKKEYICRENLEFMREHPDLQAIFEECSSELERMKLMWVFDDLSLYDVLEPRIGGHLLVSLMSRADFSKTFRACIKRESLKYYKIDLYRSRNTTMDKSEIVKTEEEKLYTIFKNLLPTLVIQRIAYFLVFN